MNAKTKTSLLPPFKTREINSRYLKNNKPLAKNDKNNANWENQDGDKDKAKSHNPSFANN